MKNCLMVCIILLLSAFSLCGQGKKLSLESVPADTVYEQGLSEAHQLFREKQYEAARARYRALLQQYPGNAYIKAKITDLDILIDYLRHPPPPPLPQAPTPEELAEKAKREKAYMEKVAREREALFRARQELLAIKKMQDIREERKEERQKGEVASREELPAGKETEEKTAAPPTGHAKSAEIKQKEAQVEQALEEFRKELARQYPSGMTEETYMDGNVKITKRIVVEGEKGNEYKRAEHPWGARYFFKNEMPITEREWLQETEKWSGKTIRDQ